MRIVFDDLDNFLEVVNKFTTRLRVYSEEPMFGRGRLIAVAQSVKNTFVYIWYYFYDREDDIKELEARIEVLERYGFIKCANIQTWEG